MIPKAETVIYAFEATLSKETRKATGAHYTNGDAVDKILDAVLTPTLDGRTPLNLPSVLDPACGAGAFLVAAYRRMLKWALDWYLADDQDKWVAARVVESRDGQWILSLNERTRILEAIHGIEINPDASAMCRFALMLVTFEDMTACLVRKDV